MKKDILTKRERVERTLNFQPVDRVAVHDQVSYNPDVISLYTGRKINGFDYTLQEICDVIRMTLDMCFPPSAPRGTKRWTDENGAVHQDDYWTSWVIKSPDIDEKKLKEKYLKNIDGLKKEKIDTDAERKNYRDRITGIQKMIGDDTVICAYPATVGICGCWDHGFIEPFTYLYYSEPEIVSEYLALKTEKTIERIHCIADKSLSPVILIADDLASKIGPVFSPAFLRKEFFPLLTKHVAAWKSHGIKVLYHSDGNWKILIDDFLTCGVDGFYCLEPAAGMDIVELKKKYPQAVWAGGLDGVDLMERGTPDAVRKEVRRQIEETDALNTGGIFLATSSEINPMIKAENYQAMIEEAHSIYNKNFK
ncbi:MAG: hypothetical protein JW957_07185 [Candidatus Omnitrophica bacterium]|nr:hypothetical protein [Candidatus Omnitrophota bacterium]